MLDRVLLVAIETPAHLHGRDALHPVHRFDPPVTGLARDIGLHVSLVREIDEVRQIVNFDPGDGLPTVPIAHDFADLWPVLGHDAVTADAFVDAGNAGDDRP